MDTSAITMMTSDWVVPPYGSLATATLDCVSATIENVYTT